MGFKYRASSSDKWKSIPFFSGTNGVSPTIKVEDIDGGHRLVITDVDGTKTVDIMDGAVSMDEINEAIAAAITGAIEEGY